MKRSRKAGAIEPAKPQPEIDLRSLEKLIEIGCTDSEIAAFFDVSLETLRYRKREKAVAEVIRRSKANARVKARLRYYDGGRVVSGGLSFRKGTE